MKSIILACIIGVSVVFAAEGQSIDSSMTASSTNKSLKYEERVSIGPYFEKSSLSNKDIDYDLKIMNRPYQIHVETSNLFGFSATLPLNTWIGVYTIAGYQYFNIKYKDKNLEQGYENLKALIDEDPFFTLDSSDVQGHFDVHHFTVQIGFDAGIPLISSYNYQTLLKLYGFAGAIGGRAIYRNTDFMNTSVWGYSWGYGIKAAIHRISVSFGCRSSFLYSRTFFEVPSQSDKDGDTFMMDPDFNGELFLGIDYSLF